MRDYDIPEDLAIERETAVLLNGVFSPGNPENIKEAIYRGECLESAFPLMGAAAGAKDYDVLGRIVYQAIYKWCQEQADSLAADRYNQGLIGNDWRDE